VSRLRIRDVLARLEAGQPVDWDGLADAADASDRELLAELRLLHEVSVAHGGMEPSLDAQPLREAWGPLRIRDRIGSGQFGQVYRAFDPRLGREVALKILSSPDAAAAAGGIIAEGHRLARIRHPNVVTVFGADCIDGVVGLWMELLTGPSLEEELAARGPFPPAELIAVGRQLAAALGAVHRAGLLHRDIKAQNVLRDAAGRAVLADFGIGLDRRAAPEAAARLAGTPLYLAPELLKGQSPTEQSDIYSLGVLLFHLATAAYPFPGEDLEKVRAAHQGEAVTLVPRIPHPGLEAVVARAMARSPRHRFRTAAELDAALGQLDDAPFPTSARTLALYGGLALTVSGLCALLATAFPVSSATVTHTQVPVTWRADMSGPPTRDGSALICSTAAGDLALCHFGNKGVEVVAAAAALGCRTSGPFASLSPDGTSVAVACSRPPPGSTSKPAIVGDLVSLGLDGTNLRTLIAPSGEEWLARPVGWAPDGRQIYAVITMRDLSQHLVRVDVATGDRAVIQMFDRERNPQTFTLSPDGRTLAWDRTGSPSQGRDIEMLDAETGRSHVIADPADDFAPTWTPEGHLLFSSDRHGTPASWVQRVLDGAPVGDAELVHETGRAVMHVKGFIDGGATLLYSLRHHDMDLFVARLGAATGGTAPRRIFQHPLAQTGAPDWSPDGARLAYLSTRGGVSHVTGGTWLTIMDLATRQVREFPTDGQPHQATIRWMPDGKSLLYRRFQIDAPPRIERRDAETGVLLETVLEARAIGDFELSQDGRTIFFAGVGIQAFDRPTKEVREVIREHPPWRIDRFSGIAVSPDDRYIAYTCFSGKESALRLIDLHTGAVRERFRDAAGISVHGWTKDGGALIVTRSAAQGKAQIGALGVHTGGIQPLGVTAPSILQLRLHPDGERVVFMGIREGAEIWKMENFARPK
jgi:Tol biopolymer transport system component